MRSGLLLVVALAALLALPSQAAAQFAIPNEFDALYDQMGVTGVNAFTANDATVYVQKVPKNRLVQWAKFEATRYSDPVWRLLLVTGFLGGYTTFSSYSFELVTMLQGGRLGWAAAYLVASNLLGVAACLGGTVVARGLLLRGV